MFVMPLLLATGEGAIPAQASTALLPTFTDYTTGGITVDASDEFNANTLAWYAANNVVGTTAGERWLGTGTTNWLRFDFGSGQVVWSYEIYFVDNPNDIEDWTFEGSDDGSSWTVLDTVTGATKQTATIEYTLSEGVRYRYYRINVTSTHGSNTNISEIQLYD